MTATGHAVYETVALARARPRRYFILRLQIIHPVVNISTSPCGPIIARDNARNAQKLNRAMETLRPRDKFNVYSHDGQARDSMDLAWKRRNFRGVSISQSVPGWPFARASKNVTRMEDRGKSRIDRIEEEMDFTRGLVRAFVTSAV